VDAVGGRGDADALEIGRAEGCEVAVREVLYRGEVFGFVFCWGKKREEEVISGLAGFGWVSSLSLSVCVCMYVYVDVLGGEGKGKGMRKGGMKTN